MPRPSAPAQRVTIQQQLDEDLDPRTFRVDDFGWGELRVELTGDQPFYQGRIDFPDDSGLVVDMTATVDVLTGIINWVFQTIDPLTGEAPLDALAGFLPPNDPQGVGEGFVTYSVRGRRNSLSGTRVDADATIVFDTNEPIDTPDIFNTLDAVPPTSQVEALPPTSTDEQFPVRWSGGDDENGSGLADFTIYVSVNDGPRKVWLANTTLTEALYDGRSGETYAFASVARDNAGNEEALLAEADTLIFVGGPATIGDLVWRDDDGDGVRDDGEPGVPGVTVNLLDASGTPLQTTFTDADGRYRFETLDPTQPYAVEMILPSGFAFSPQDQGEDDARDSDVDSQNGRTPVFSVLPGDNLDWDAGLVPLGSISGVVWDDLNGNGVREQDEPLLSDWTVFLDEDEDGEFDSDEERSETTGIDGSYRFDGLRPGAYVVALRLQDGWTQTLSRKHRSIERRDRFCESRAHGPD